MERKSKLNVVIICALLVTIIMMSVGYAALSQNLEINGTAKIQNAADNWNVYFSSVEDSSTTGYATLPAAKLKIETKENSKGTNNLVSFECNLVAPGDTCTVDATITNGGTIRAKYTGYTLQVDGSTVTSPYTVDDKVKVTVTPLTTDLILAKEDSASFKVKMELLDVEELPENEESHSVVASINFEQTGPETE